MNPMNATKNVLWWLIANSSGGINRGRILMELSREPQNANNLSNNLSLDYKTVRYHLGVLLENGMVVSVGKGYGKTYFHSDDLEENWAVFEEIWNKIGNNIVKSTR